MSGIKSCFKKKYSAKKNDDKKKKFFCEKMFVWIKDDRDSVTRPKSENVEIEWKMKKSN